MEAFYLGNFAGPSFVAQNHLAPYVADGLGISGVPATRFEAACASGGSAFFHAVSSVAAGLYDLVLVVGVEKMTSPADAASRRNPGRRGRSFRRDEGRRDLPCPVRHDRAAAHAPVRNDAARIWRRWR